MKNIFKLRSSIKTKLISMFVFMIIVPLSVMGISSYFRANSLMNDTVKNYNLELSRQASNYIDNYTKAYEEALTQMAQDNDIQNVENGGNINLIQKNFDNFMAAHKEVGTIYIGTKTKKFYLSPMTTMDSSYDPTARPWYTDALAKKSIIWTDPYIDEASKKFEISVAMPVYNSARGNEFVGVIALDIYLDKLSDAMSAIKSGETGYALAIAADNTILFHKDKTLVGTKVEDKTILSAISSKSEGTVNYNWKDNNKTIPKYAVFTKNAKLKSTIMVTNDLQEISSKTSPLWQNSIIIGIISIVIAIVISWFFTSTLTKPISVLLHNMNKVREGDFTVEIDVKSNDEIGILGRGFNTMVSDMKLLINNLQKVSLEMNNSAVFLASSSEETSASADSVSKAAEEIFNGCTRASYRIGKKCRTYTKTCL